MRLLPSEQEVKVNEAIAQFEAEGKLTISEPCNCGDNVRHNNGGNYHDIIYLRQDSGQLFVKYTDTCELKPPAEWENFAGDYKKLIQNYADWL